MKQFVPIVLSLMGSVTFGSLAAGADPVVYISNQTGFAKPIIYGWGFGVPGDYSTYFDLGSSGLTPQGTKTVDGITYDKFEVPADAVGKTVSLQYYDNWSYQKPDYEITFEDKEYYLLANAAGLKEVTAGGVNRYVQLYLENQTDFTQDKNKFTVYATSAGGTELLGAYPGVSYDAVRRVEGVDYYIWDMPYGTTPYTFTFSNEPNGYKLEDGPVITPDKDTFVRITNSSYTVLPDPRSASVTISNIVYTIDKTASTARVDGMADPAEAIASLVIPATVAYDGKDYAVTSIADGAFNGCTNLSGTLSLGENLVTIGKNAFSGCQNLSGSVVIGDKVTSIGESAFSSCIGFDGTLTLGASVAAIGKNSFLMCSGLTGALTIPESVTSVGAGAFSGCYGFDGALTIGGAVTSIGAQAFMGCRNLTGALTLPESVTSLGESSFMSCSGFNGALILPSGLTKIEDNIFFGCDNLTGSLTIPAGVTAIGRAAFSGCKKLSGTLTIPAAVTTVGDNAFFDCSGFNGSLELGGNITSIGSGAFMNCSGMWGWLTLPSSLETIGSTAFFGCEKFSGPLSIPENVTSIGNLAFGNCTGFKGKLTLGKNLTSIGDQAFISCEGLTGALVIPDGVKAIGYRTFGWCYGLTSLELPASVTSLGNVAFYGCWNLKTITCNATVPPVIAAGEAAFDSDNYTEATLYVPTASLDDYRQGYEWSEFRYMLGIGAVAAETVTLDQSQASVEAGQNVTITAEVGPADTTDKTVVWYTSDAAVATVADGVVTGVAEGTAVITAICGTVKAECSVTVTPSTGIGTVNADGAPAEYFNLQGIRVADPAPGTPVIEKTAAGARVIIPAS